MLPVCYLNISFSACKTTKSKGFQRAGTQSLMQTEKHKQAERRVHTGFIPYFTSLHYFNATKRAKEKSECHYSNHQCPRRYRVAAALQSRLLFRSSQRR